VDAAFSTMQQLGRLMSVHAPDSEVSLLNREAADRPVSVSRVTFQVLRLANRLAVESDGAFDHTVAPLLARWGMRSRRLRRDHPGDWRHVLLMRGRQVRFLRPLALDLGGIAKGFAVDEAIEVLRGRGVASAVVNAGGDLRVFGKQPITTHLRHPANARALAGAVSLHEAALATSSPCFTERVWRGRRVSHLVDSRRQEAVTGPVSVTVRAPECWLADALTKVILNAPQLAARLLPKHNAEAFLLTT
jgi:thiamine biosynthesis lipoprotein